jgi:hypothetical protein
MRISSHLSSIRLKYTTPVSDHFNQVDHSLSDCKFFGLLSNSNWSDIKRKSVENKWITKLNTLAPTGINKVVNRNITKFVTIPFKGKNSVPISLSQFIDDCNVTSFTTGSPLRVSFNHKHSIARDHVDIH